ncbi:alpha/beta hydrolase [Flavobacterium sp. DG1-102-2]|uniref:alpha/beta hydrolase n=1 Tax=Flavobacterium sp. DG1-102-2 TaxID=3081663 RepID=UPI00294A372F|nr:alpha/beta hydrolase [Flavobacterium sp. DG1-102-2]MDV6166797.1 alpha/beta hydrolase [Flavobacterium sp. DG1-102-2]
MKNLLIIPLLLLFLITGCGNSDDENNAPLEAQTLTDVSYGTDAQQKIDIFLPYDRSINTKVIVLLHGGSWVGGDKSDVASLVPVLKIQFPDHAIVNMNYRLATETSPAYPKQIDDIKSVLEHLKSNNYQISSNYAFIGFSAGAHLSLLYAYAYDTEHNVKAICDVVGPADFTDPNYTSHPLYPSASQVLVGSSSPTQEQIETINPVNHITTQSPPTISFYGGQDPLVPATQGPRLKAALDNANVYNEYNLYANGGHGDWDEATYADVYSKMTLFLKNRF